MIVTGAGSGFGRFVQETLGGVAWTRALDANTRTALRRDGTDVIVHCAFTARAPRDLRDLAGYVDDNVRLTEELVGIPHRQFILLSTVDVYPRIAGSRTEEDPLDLQAPRELYATTKLMAEAIVAARATHPVILRCGALLGPYIRRNSLVRMLEEEDCRLTLSGASCMNYVLHEDVVELVRMAIKQQWHGTYNVASTEMVTLEEVAALIGRHVTFGSHRYDTGAVDTRKLLAVCPRFRKTSREVAAAFVESWRAQRSSPASRPSRAAVTT